MSTHLCCALDLRSAPVDDTRMAYAILRTSKLKSWGNISGSAAHTYRHKGMAPNADPLRMGKNKVLVGRPGEAVEDIRNRISAITDKPRKNGVLCVEHLLTASPEFFEKLTSKQVDAWARKNLQFLAKTYGKENVVHAVLHPMRAPRTSSPTSSPRRMENSTAGPTSAVVRSLRNSRPATPTTCAPWGWNGA